MMMMTTRSEAAQMGDLFFVHHALISGSSSKYKLAMCRLLPFHGTDGQQGSRFVAYVFISTTHVLQCFRR